jgi:hypothetical protein
MLIVTRVPVVRDERPDFLREPSFLKFSPALSLYNFAVLT